MEYGIIWHCDENGDSYGGDIRQGCCGLTVECTKKPTRRYPYEKWFVEVTDNGVDFQTIYICDSEKQARDAANRLTLFICNEAEKVDKESTHRGQLRKYVRRPSEENSDFVTELNAEETENVED